MDQISLIGLVKMELPDGDALICDGGFIEFASEIYRDVDPVWGAIRGVEPLSEGIGDTVPALQLTLLPPGSTLPGAIHQPGMQASRVRFWIGEYNLSTGVLSGSPLMVFDGQVDQCTLDLNRNERWVTISVVSTAERLFERNIGNSLSPVFHKAIWPGELGHDNATGLGLPFAWGTASPPSQAVQGVAVGTAIGRVFTEGRS